MNQSLFKIHAFIGYCETSVYYIISNLDQEITFDLHNDKTHDKCGQIILKYQQANKSNFYVKGILQVSKLKKMKMKIYKFKYDNSFQFHMYKI